MNEERKKKKKEERKTESYNHFTNDGFLLG